MAFLASGTAHTLRAQTLASMNQSYLEEEIGVPRYVQPEEPRYRVLFGFGGNAGLGALTPATYVGDASYQMGISLLSAGFVSSASVTQNLPRRSYSEFDLLYGIAMDQLLARYERPSDYFHAGLTAGIGFDAYRERWRRFGRPSSPVYYLYPPNTFKYSLGLPIQLQAIYEPFRYAGIGALLFCNFSSFAPSYGGALVIEARY